MDVDSVFWLEVESPCWNQCLRWSFVEENMAGHLQLCQFIGGGAAPYPVDLLVSPASWLVALAGRAFERSNHSFTFVPPVSSESSDA